MNIQEMKDKAREEWNRIYPLQQWSETNPDQAIIINPTLQKSHKELCWNFIDTFIERTVKSTEERIVKTLGEVDLLIENLEKPANWMAEHRGQNWKSATSKYDRTPFEVAKLLRKVINLITPTNESDINK